MGSRASRRPACYPSAVRTFVVASRLHPGCGACIGAGPGVSTDAEQVTVSAINRNFQGRSGPGRLYLASPLTVAASAFTGEITAWRDDLFA